MRGSWLVVLGVILVAGCSSRPPAAPPSQAPPLTASPSPTFPAPEPSPRPKADPQVRRIPDAQWRAMVAAGVVRADCPLGRADLSQAVENPRMVDGGVTRGVRVVIWEVAE